MLSTIRQPPRLLGAEGRTHRYWDSARSRQEAAGRQGGHHRLGQRIGLPLVEVGKVAGDGGREQKGAIEPRANMQPFDPWQWPY